MKLAHYLFLFTSLLSSFPVRGESPKDQAKAHVRTTMEKARSKAAEAVAGDFNFAMTTVLNSMVTQPEVLALSSSFLQQQKDLFKALTEIEKLDTEQAAQIKSKALSAYETYKKISRQRADLSFQMAEARDQSRESLRAAVLILQQFASNCKTGRGIGGLGEKAFRYPTLPKPDFGISVSTSSADIRYNGTGSKDEKNRNDFLAVTGSVASNIVFTGYTGTGTTAAMCAAATPWVIAGGLAVAVVVAYINAEERVKLENEIVEGENITFHESATDQAIGQFYREQCQDLVDRTAPIMDVFMKAINSPEELEKMAATTDFATEMDKLTALMGEREKIHIQMKDLENKKDQESLQKLQELANQVISLEQEIAKISTPEHIAGMAVQVLLSQQESFSSKFSLAALNSLDMAQRRAFDNILRILTLVQRKEFARFLSEDDEISKELEAVKEFASARRFFKDVVSMQIKFIFGKTTALELEKSQSQLGQATRSLLNKHASSKEVANFSRQVHHLIGKF